MPAYWDVRLPGSNSQLTYREPLAQAIAITGSAALGPEMADSLYSEMFGLTERGGQRGSPLAYYSGRDRSRDFFGRRWLNGTLTDIAAPPARARL